ncbi:MAG: sterol desaturase family protein, partial [Acidimicrobiales bacterium]
MFTSSTSVTPQEPAARTGALTRGGIALGAATLAMLGVALTVRSGVVFGLVVLAVTFVPLERIFALHPRKVLRAGWRTDIVHFMVDNLVSTIGLIIPIVVVGLGLRALLPSSLHHAVAAQPVAAQFVEGFLIGSFTEYFGHRAAHRVPLLWRFHKVHHSITEMDWLASAHLHPIDTVWTRGCTVIPLFVLGFSRGSFGGIVVLATVQAIFIHANVRLTFGPLRWLVATPEFHHWHHAADEAAHDTNFAGEFPWIDALFGTLYLPKGQMPASYGIEEVQPDGYLRQLAWPFRSPAA